MGKVGICAKYTKIFIKLYNIYRTECVRTKFLSVKIIILKIWDLILIDIWYQKRWITMFLNAKFFKQLKISVNKIDDRVSMSFLRTSQGQRHKHYRSRCKTTSWPINSTCYAAFCNNRHVLYQNRRISQYLPRFATSFCRGV